MSRVKSEFWFVAEKPGIGVGGLEVSVVVDRRGLPVANCGSGRTGAVNARLVSMAPSMLRVIHGLLAEHPDTSAEYVSASVRIARQLVATVESFDESQ